MREVHGVLNPQIGKNTRDTRPQEKKNLTSRVKTKQRVQKPFVIQTRIP